MKKQDFLEKQVRSSYLGIGSNLGDKYENIEKAKILLNKHNIYIEDASNYYETPSWPNKKLPRFFNIVIKIKTQLSLIELFNIIKKIEKNIGRKKTFRNQPRVCDIDIIDFKGLYKKASFRGQKIESPHPRMHTRNFVIFPLYELDKTWFHPKKKANINSLIGQFNKLDFSDIRIV